MKDENLLILYSGGSDSRLLLELAFKMKKRPYCILIDYGQKHIKELDFARIQLNNNNVDYRYVRIKGLRINSGLTGDNVESQYEGVHPMNVPSRNLMFISIAAGIAEDMKIDTIWYGANNEDYINKFPDCNQEWVGRVNETLEINSSIPIKLETPLMGFSREAVLSLSDYFGIEQKNVFSGYGD